MCGVVVDPLDLGGVVHLGNEGGEHPVRRVSLAHEVGRHASLAFGRHDVDVDGALLAESPHAPDGLIILLKRVRREESGVPDVLPVEAPSPYLRLGNEALDFPLGEVFFVDKTVYYKNENDDKIYL